MLLYVNPLSTARGAESLSMPEDRGREKLALEELEHHFVFTLLQEMRKSMPEGGIFPRSQQEKIYEEMLDDAMSAEIARSGQFGIAKMVAEQLRIEEMQKKLQGMTTGVIEDSNESSPAVASDGGGVS